MKLAPKIAGMAVAVLAVGGAGIGTIAAASASTTHPAAVRTASSEPTSPDTDAIQQGDQTSPDTATAITTGPVKAQSDNPGEAPESASESSSASDGPGGNADPAGNVQHEFSGTE
jgi:hypothetical protein